MNDQQTRTIDVLMIAAAFEVLLTEKEKTEGIISFYTNEGGAVQVKAELLADIADPSTWTWSGRSSSEKYPYSAHIWLHGVKFIAVFSANQYVKHYSGGTDEIG